MSTLRFRPYEPATARKARRADEGQWEAHRDQIHDLYVIQKKTLKKVMKTLEEVHGFVATRPQYEHQLASWGIRKNLPRAVSVAACRKLDQKPIRTSLTYKGEPIAIENILRSRKRRRDVKSTSTPPAMTPPELDWRSPGQHVSLPIDEPTTEPTTEVLDDYKHTIDSIERLDYDTFEAISGGEAIAVLDLSRNETEFPVPNAALTWHDRRDLPARIVTSQVTSLPTPGKSRNHTTSPTLSLRKLPTAVSLPKKSDLTIKDYAAEHRLIWCLWASGPEYYDQFSRLTRGDCNWRERFTDLAEQHNYPIRQWLASGIGVGQDISQAVMGLHEARQPQSDITITASPADSALTCPTAFAAFHARGILKWQTHAAYGFNLATLRVQGRDDEATRLRQRLIRDMPKASGGPSFLLGFKYILEECGAYLGSDAKKLFYWKEKYFGQYFKNQPKVRQADGLAIGLLSNVCYLRWVKVQGSGQADREAEILRITGFHVVTAFQWALRLLLHLSSSSTKNPSYTMSLEPTDLCYRILRGLNCIWKGVDFFPRSQSDRLEPLISDLNVQDNWKKEILVRIWVEWLGEDEDWFLPTIETRAAALSSLSKVRNSHETEIVDENFSISAPSQHSTIPHWATRVDLQKNLMTADDEAILWEDSASVILIAMEDQNFLQELKTADYIDIGRSILWNGLTECPILSDPWALNPDFDAFEVSYEPTAQQEQSSLEGYIGITPKLAASQERLGMVLAPNPRQNATRHSPNHFEISALYKRYHLGFCPWA